MITANSVYHEATKDTKETKTDSWTVFVHFVPSWCNNL